MKTLLVTVIMSISSASWALQVSNDNRPLKDLSAVKISCAFGFVRASQEASEVFKPSKVDLKQNEGIPHYFYHTITDAKTGLFGQVQTSPLGYTSIDNSNRPPATILLFERKGNKSEVLEEEDAYIMIDVGDGHFIPLDNYYQTRAYIFAIKKKSLDALKHYGLDGYSRLMEYKPMNKLTEMISKAVKEGRLAEGELLGVGLESCDSNGKN